MAIKAPEDKLIIAGISNYGKPRQEYADKLAALSDREFEDEAKNAIWLSAYASNNPRSDYHWHADTCYDEAQRRGKAEIYTRAWERASS